MSRTHHAKHRHSKYKKEVGCCICDPYHVKGKLRKEQKKKLKDDLNNW